jgi:hypothetical protein
VTAVDFLEQLRRQMGFLRRSCESFDAGDQAEAVRIATCIRVLVHDTRHSTSLLTHLGAKHIRLRSTVAPIPPNAIVAERLISWTGGANGIEARPRLRMSATDRFLPVQEWWLEVVAVPSREHRMTRRDLVLGAADRDGGAHVDATLTPDYHRLKNAWTAVGGLSDSRTIEEVPLVSLRTLGYEVLMSPELRALAGLPMLPEPQLDRGDERTRDTPPR